MLLDALESETILQIGQVKVDRRRVWHGDNVSAGKALSSPAALRAHLRDEPFRPQASSGDLPAGWQVKLARPDDAHAVIETIYPGLVADWAANKRGNLKTASLEEIGARQRGMFKDIGSLPESVIKLALDKICGTCIRRPTWWPGYSPAASDLPCRSACNLWLSSARQLGEATVMNRGTVYLVGAGPGDPDLITLKGLRLLRRADVVIYDRLIPHELLDETRPDAELIDAGKQPTRHRLAQESINRLVIDRARKGDAVVRLKGGDPFVFGRGGEEALACHEQGIPFEVVPGATSAVAVPAYAGIPLTDRKLSSSFTVITGHEDPAKDDSSINYAALARVGGTIVIMMGVNRLSAITLQLIRHGMHSQIPAAIIEAGATARQRAFVGHARIHCSHRAGARNKAASDYRHRRCRAPARARRRLV